MIRGRWHTDYWVCPSCGLVQTGPPHWLAEAHAQAIAALDTGLLARNVRLATLLTTILYVLDGGRRRYLDVAGGYGILTRLMRDAGFDYYWRDPYCANRFATGFEAAKDDAFGAVSAIEVLEHVYDPLGFLADTRRRTGCDTLLLTTLAYSGNEPPPPDWWYYSRETGQHVSFFHVRTLRRLAQRLDMQYAAFAEVHVLTTRRGARGRLRLVQPRAIRHVCAYLVRRHLGSRTEADRARLLAAPPPGGTGAAGP